MLNKANQPRQASNPIAVTNVRIFDDAKEMRMEFHMRTAPLILLVALIILISLMAVAKDTIVDNGTVTSCPCNFDRSSCRQLADMASMLASQFRRQC